MEALFESPLILILLIGIISSFFKNKNKDGKQKSHENKPAQKGNRTFDELKDIFQEFNRTFQEEAKPVVNSEKVLEAKESIQSAYMEKVEESSLPRNVERVKTLPVSKASKSQPQIQLQVDETKIVDAVIWSEILGPPRAKNPRFKNRIYKKY